MRPGAAADEVDVGQHPAQLSRVLGDVPQWLLVCRHKISKWYEKPQPRYGLCPRQLGLIADKLGKAGTEDACGVTDTLDLGRLEAGAGCGCGAERNAGLA